MVKNEYLRVILTERCNLSCFFCHKEGETAVEKQKMSREEVFQMIQVCLTCGTKKIKFLGGEPTLVPWLPEIISDLRSKSPGLDISVVSNGIAPTSVMMRLINSGLNRVNISLHGFDETLFKNITGGNRKQLNDLFASISLLSKHYKLGKLNYVLLKGVNEHEFFEVLNYANQNHLVVDVLNYLGTNEEDVKRYRYSFDEIVSLVSSEYIIERMCRYENRYSLPSTRLYLRGGAVINLKTTQLNSTGCYNSCSTCRVKEFCTEGIKAIRITPNGKIRPCVFRDDNCFDLLEVIKEKGIDGAKDLFGEFLRDL